MSNRIIGIMGAIPEEIHGVVSLMKEVTAHEIGGRTYYQGEIHHHKVVVVYARVGKVAAATTITTLILSFNITQLIFTGVAGGIHNSVKIGDIVIGTHLIQHDMDARPLWSEFEIPLLGKSTFESDKYLVQVSNNAITNLLSDNKLHSVIAQEDLNNFDIHNPRMQIGLIASGDQFFGNADQRIKLQEKLPNVLCVEMEGAAVAQVCDEFNIPFIIIRTISDDANEHSTIDFTKFIDRISNVYGLKIIDHILAHL